jgi:tetratricopeptide (TPR) repeat protein
VFCSSLPVRAAVDFDLLMRQGHSQMLSGQYEQAFNSYSQCLSAKNNCMQAKWYKAVILGNLKRYSEAELEFTELIALAPENAALYRSRAGMFIFLGQYKLAFDDCNKAIALDGRDGKAYDFRGTAHLCLGMKDQAEEDRQKALEMNSAAVNIFENPRLPMFAPAAKNAGNSDEKVIAKSVAPTASLSTRASALMKYGNWKDALDCLDKVLKMAPGDQGARCDRLICLAELGEYRKVIAEVNMLLQQFGSVAALYALRAECQASLGQTNLAHADAEKSLRLKPKLPEGHRAMGRVYSARRQWNNAIDEFKLAIKLCPDSAENYCALANVYCLTKELPKANQAYSQAILVNKYFPAAYLGRALCFENVAQHRFALDDYAFVLKMQPDNLQALEGHMRVAFVLKQYARVVEDATKILGKKPGSELCFLYRAKAYESLGMGDKSLSDLNSLIANSPEHKEAISLRLHQLLAEPLDKLSESKLAEVLVDVNRLLTSKEDKLPLYHLRMKIEKLQKKYSLVIEDATTILALKSSDWLALEERAMAQLELGNNSQAITDLSDLIKVAPHSRLYKLRAKAHQKMGKESLAIRDQELALDLESRERKGN